jgi:hypothetical protein
MDTYEQLIKLSAKRALKRIRDNEDAARLRAAKKHAAQALAANRKRASDGNADVT